MDLSMPGFPVHHQLPELAQTHVYRVSDAISSSVIPFSSCPQSFPALGSFPMSPLFAPGCQSIRGSTSAWTWMNIQGWSPLVGWVGLVGSPCSPRDSQGSFPTPQFKSINSSVLCLFYCPTLKSLHDSEKTIALTIWTFVNKVMSLLFNTVSSFVIAFLPRSKCLLIL